MSSNQNEDTYKIPAFKILMTTNFHPVAQFLQYFEWNDFQYNCCSSNNLQNWKLLQALFPS